MESLKIWYLDFHFILFAWLGMFANKSTSKLKPLWEHFFFFHVLHFLCFIFLFWVSHDYERLTYPLLEVWIPKLYDGVIFTIHLMLIILVLLFSFYVYCFNYGLITHIHVCYRILITGKCFHKELEGTSKYGLITHIYLCIFTLKENYLV